MTRLEQVKHLYDLGFAIHLLKPKGKAPLLSGWTSGPRHSWEFLEKNFKKEMNVGVRLGKVSKLSDGTYLGAIDCDIKSIEFNESQAKEFNEALEKLRLSVLSFNSLSGRGNGSGHVFIRTRNPIKPSLLARSKETVKVLMPSAKIPSSRDKKELSKEELEQGYRIRPAWEISLMGEGQQVALPPSIHPDTDRMYSWLHAINRVEDIPIFEGLLSQEIEREVLKDFKIAAIDLLDVDVEAEILDAILSGKNVTDRSKALFQVSARLVQIGLSDDEILTILTDNTTFLGETAYDHAKTNSRKRAAEWIYKYTLEPARRRWDAKIIFENAPESSAILDEISAEKQKAEIVDRPEDRPWEEKLQRTKAGLKPSFSNICSILDNAVNRKLFKRNIFNMEDTYGADAPWGTKCESHVNDDEILRLKAWLIEKYQLEASLSLLCEVVSSIAIRNEFHPVREYLQELDWDGAPRLDTWLKKHFHAEGDSEYLGQVFRKWMVGAIKRVFEPGCKFDWMPILEGLQGVGKSTFASVLASDDWFIDKISDLASKDSALDLVGVWIYEMGELSDLRRNQIEVCKAFITRREDKVRPPYGRKKITLYRQTVLIGSTNRVEYLKDDTGNRRFKPVLVGQLDFKQLKKDRDQLWAEANFIYQNGLEETLELTGKAKEYETTIHSQKRVSGYADFMVELIHQWGDKNADEKMPQKDLSLTWLFEDRHPLDSMKSLRGCQNYAGEALRLLGYKRRINSKGRAVWDV